MSKKRWTLFVVLVAMSLACVVSVMRMGAANPTSGMAVALAPTNPAEFAILVPALLPGPYTAILRGKNDTTGIGVVEIFNVP